MNDTLNICTVEDDFVRDQYERQTRWVVDLNDGTRVFQDDDRPGTTEPAWIRLKKYCESTGKYIKSLSLQFRSHIEHIGSDAEGFYFSKGATSYYGDNKTFHDYIAGVLKDGKLYVKKWRVPELLSGPEEERSTDTKIAEVCLIKRKQYDG